MCIGLGDGPEGAINYDKMISNSTPAEDAGRGGDDGTSPIYRSDRQTLSSGMAVKPVCQLLESSTLVGQQVALKE